MNDNFIKTIDLLQSCITRMSQNSFMVKGWTITLTGIILALVPETFDVRLLCIICLILILCFWILDTFYLQKERLFRHKYKLLIKNPERDDLFFDLDISSVSKNNKKFKFFNIMFSLSVWPIYIPLLLATIVTFINQYTHWFVFEQTESVCQCAIQRFMM